MRLTQTTISTSAKDITREWFLVDAGEQILGRCATDIAKKLMGKSKPTFVRYLDMGDYVVVINAQKVQVTGKKLKEKIYTTYSGYPGGLKEESFVSLRERRPESVIRRAVYNMLPKNKLRDQLITRLYVFAGAEHPYQEKFKTQKAKKSE